MEMTVRTGSPFPALLLLAAVACSSEPRIEPVAEPEAAVERPLKTLGSLETTNERIDFLSGAGDVVFTVTSRSGELILEQATREELDAKLPEISAHIDKALAELMANVDESALPVRE